MNIHWLQHVPFEGLGLITEWVEQHHRQLSCTRLYLGERLPPDDEVDMLIIMGGPMGIHDDQKYPWLAAEKQFVRRCIKHGKIVVGICLGAQLLAHALGAEITRNRHTEIGWYEVVRRNNLPLPLLEIIPERFNVLHWHGDTFTIPAECSHLLESQACVNQAFIYENRCLGLQFHLEMRGSDLQPMIENCRDELHEDQWIQNEEQLLADTAAQPECRKVLFALLDYLVSQKNS